MKLVKSRVVTDKDILHRVSKEVNLEDVVLTSNLQNLLLNKFNIEFQKKKQGLAAIQLGQEWRVILLRYKRGEDPIVCFNPTVDFAIGVRHSKERCESERDDLYRVKRPMLVRVTYYTRYKEKVTKWLPYKKARIFCHEVDHCNGILLSDKGRLIMEGKYLCK